MEFTKPSDIGIFDGFTEWYHFAAEVFMIAIAIAIVINIISYIKSTGFTLSVVALSIIALLLITMPALVFRANEKEAARNENISKVFNVSEDQKYELFDYSRVEDNIFTDVKTTIKDTEAQKMYDVTFGFKESGEPFIYETGEVNKDFIENLKK